MNALQQDFEELRKIAHELYKRKAAKKPRLPRNKKEESVKKDTLSSSDYYPPLSECYAEGMNHGCSERCPVWQRGECDNEDTLKQSEKEGWRKYEEN